jgi:hypothetical protein
MIKPLNALKIDLACMGNHEFDYPIDRVEHLKLRNIGSLKKEDIKLESSTLPKSNGWKHFSLTTRRYYNTTIGNNMQSIWLNNSNLKDAL